MTAETLAPEKNSALTPEEIPGAVADACSPQELIIDDEHTHLLHHTAGDDLCFWGIVRLLTYHYVRRILFNEQHVEPEVFYSWSLKEQAEFTWQKLFVNRLEDCTDEGRKGVIMVMKLLGLDPNAKTLDQVFEFYADHTAESIQKLSCRIAGVRRVVGTQDMFKAPEREFYKSGNCGWGTEMRAAVRLDEPLLHWTRAVPQLARLTGLDVSNDPRDAKTQVAVRKFLESSCKTLQDVAYVASSFGPEIRVDDLSTPLGILLDEVVLPFCAERNLPFFMMPGPIRALNSTWRDAGDGVGICDMSPYQQLVRRHPDTNFLLTPLHYANQYDASVMTCHNKNLKVIGQWWFQLTQAQLEATLRMRLEMTGCRFIAFNSDARVWENLINKWLRFREVLTKVITEQQLELQKLGVIVTKAGIERAVRRLFDLNFAPKG